ncbi:MAG: hypothetical protein IJY88_08480 [Clostridia bacterium]|nr:hypothetical protein [Clostridia bacterium]
MAKSKKNPLRWVRLDNAAKIYPAAMRKNWSNIYRQSMTLYEEIDTVVLKSALEVTVKRFPSIAARLRRGAFWFYLQQVEAAPEIQEEKSHPLCYMSEKEMSKYAFRVIAYRNRIAVEFFHSLTDGTGALIFLKNLVAEYLEQKHNISIPFEQGIIDRRVPPKSEELEDSFLKYAGRVPASRRDTNAWRVPGEKEPEGFIHVTCFKADVDSAIALAHKYGCTLTVFFSAVMMQALMNYQKELNPNTAKHKPIKLLIPINLRTLFKSETLRNFAMFTVPEIDARLGEYSFEEICKAVYHKMGYELTQKHMSAVIAKNVNDEKNILLRLVPLPLKNIVMKAVFDRSGERKSCLSMSNLGVVRLPEIMQKYVSRVDFILGVQATAPYNCGFLSYNGKVYINLTRNIRDAGLERHFFEILRDMGLEVTVESNRN